MALTLSKRAKALLAQTGIKAQIILEIDGFEDSAIFGAVPVEKFARIGEDELTIGEFFIGGVTENKLSRAYIATKGTTSKISQQIIPDQGGSGSIQKINIKLIDKNGEITKLFAPGNIVPDMRGTRARVYSAFQNGAHPEDSVLIMSGIIKDLKFGPGYAKIAVGHAEELKRQTLFTKIDVSLKDVPQAQTSLSANIDAVVTTITGLDTSTFTAPVPGFDYFIKIGSEVIQYAGISGQDFTGCIRGSRGTVAAAHLATSTIDTEYVLSPTSTFIPLENTFGLLFPEDILTTFVVIEDEVIEYTSINGDTLEGCIRGSRKTIAVEHELDNEAGSFYVLEEDTIPLMLKLLFSGENQFFTEDLDILHFNINKPTEIVQNAIIFTHPDIQFRYGLTEGDKVVTTGSVIGANNVSRTILSFGTFDGTSYILVDGAALVDESDTAATISFESQYRTMTQAQTGCNVSPEQVDTERFIFWQDLLGDTFPVYRFELFDSINAKEFIDKQLAFPAALYSVPRKGRISLQYSLPPLALEDIVRLDLSNVLNPEKLEIANNINKYFYNTVEYKHNYDAIKNKYFRRNFRISQDSFERIKNVGVKKLVIEAQGMRKDLGADEVITTQSRRIINRYRFGAERIEGVQVSYKVGMTIEVADAVLVDGESLRLVDTSRGDRLFAPRLFEVIDKEWDYIQGKVKLDLLDVGLSVDGRFGVMGPSSFIASGSTTTEIRIKRSFGTGENDLEIEKWPPYVGEKIQIRHDDYDFFEEVTIESILESRNDTLVISPPLSIVPPEGYVVDMPDYSGDAREKGTWKNLHCYVGPVADVVTGISDTQFTVSVADATLFFAGAFARVHDPDFSTRNSERIEVIDITGVTVTMKESLGFTPLAGDECRPIGFSDDSGLPYNYI